MSPDRQQNVIHENAKMQNSEIKDKQEMQNF